MTQLIKDIIKTIFIMGGALLVTFAFFALAQDSVKTENEILGKVKTVYDTTGRPANQQLDAKGWHVVVGSIKLAGGRGVVNVNTSIAEGRQDVTFISQATYRGSAWSADTTNNNTYFVTPITGSKALVRSSSGTDTATVYFHLEGE